MQAKPPDLAPRLYRHLCVVPDERRPMTADCNGAGRAAAEWFVLLREEPDHTELHARFAEWRDADPQNAKAWAEMHQTARAIAAARPEPHTHDRSRATLAPRRIVRPRWAFGSRPHRPVGRKWQAGGIALALAAAFLAFPRAMLRLEADHVSSTGAIEIVQLDDGSKVTLGPDSAIAVDYEQNRRTVRLITGQANFAVRHNPARPFRVAARNVTATVLGTQFDVRMIGSETSVSVAQGRVSVAADGQSRELTVGQWLRAAPGAQIAVGTETPSLVGAWQTGTVAVRNRPIAEAIDEVRPWYGGKIMLASGALADKRITGTYDLRDPVRSLSLMVAPYGGRVLRISPWLLIVTNE